VHPPGTCARPPGRVNRGVKGDHRTHGLFRCLRRD
jgi:hypothetical protein